MANTLDDSGEEVWTEDGYNEAPLGSDTPSLAFLREVAHIPEASPDPFDTKDPAIPGRFQVRRRLGAGGFGAVYEAFDQERDASVALKVLRRQDGLSISRFKRELRSLVETSHSNLVQLYELHADGDTWYFTMELLRGEHALSYLRPAGGPLDKARLRSVFQQLATGLTYLHRAGKLHLDVKPSNVMVKVEGRVVLVDFGLVREGVDPEVRRGVAGTPAYMAPEQAAGLAVGEAADWYAMGVMLYQALTGRLPGSDGDPCIMEVTSQDLGQLCRSLLARAPEDRPSGREVLQRLEIEPLATDGMGVEPGFVGRKAQLAELHEALATAKHRNTTVLVRGPAGMGKSALIRRFLEDLRVDEPGRLALFGRCFEQESVPYKGVDGLLEDLGRRLRERAAPLVPPPGLQSLALLFPQLAEVLGVRPGPSTRGPDALLLRARGIAALRALIVSAGVTTLVVDDLHWGDQDSVALLAALLHDSKASPLLLVCSFRAEDAEINEVLRAFFAALDGLGERVEVRHVEVGRLEDQEAAALSRALLEADRRSPIAEEAVAALVAEGQGNPLLLSELGWRRSGSSSGALDLGALLADRIGRLPAPARRLLEVLAVDGQPVARPEKCVRSVEFEAKSNRIRGPSTVRRVDGAADQEPGSGMEGVHPAHPHPDLLKRPPGPNPHPPYQYRSAVTFPGFLLRFRPIPRAASSFSISATISGFPQSRTWLVSGASGAPASASSAAMFAGIRPASAPSRGGSRLTTGR